MKLKKIWELAMTVAVVVFVYLAVKTYFPNIILFVKETLYGVWHGILNFLSTV